MKKTVAILDYKVGNIKSIINALSHYGVDVRVTADHHEILKSNAVVLPGVGSFAHGMKNLKTLELDKVLYEYVTTNRPIMGICLGMQLLMDTSCEFGETTGLGLIPGNVEKLKFEEGCSLPHIGWEETRLLNNEKKDYFFCHSYVVVPQYDENILATSQYGSQKFCAAVRKRNITGFQFHPEKSGPNGLQLIEQFITTVEL